MAKTQNKIGAVRSIKISEQAHYQLRMMSAKYGGRIWELVDQAIVLLGREKAAKNGNKAKGGVR